MFKQRALRWLLPLAAIAAGGAVSFCVPQTTGAPCLTSANCPNGQFCDPTGHCAAGPGGPGADAGPDGGNNPLPDGGLPDGGGDAGSQCGPSVGCPDASYCTSGSCVSQKGNAAPCDAGVECLSGFCTGQICCDQACADSCGSCNAPGHDAGLCSPLDAGTAGFNPSCAPFLCDGTSLVCPTRCASVGDCAPGATCTGNACVGKKGGGQPCALPGDCVSNFCVDGVCCDGACDGGCEACNAAATLGACSADPQGNVGRSCSPYVCNGTGRQCPGTCGIDLDCIASDYCKGGTCTTRAANGQPCTATNQCASGICAGGFCCATSCGSCGTCSSGTCVDLGGGNPGSPTCAPYVCANNSDACPTSCTVDAVCAAADYCNGTGCVAKKGLGAGCTAADQCASGFCANNVCCGSACGSCGSCDGTGTCNNSPAGSSGGCGQYVCSGANPACPTSCTADMNCISGDFCDTNASVCVAKLGNTVACTGNNQCSSGFCVSGHCCASACGSCGTCGGGTCVPSMSGSPGAPSCSPFVCDGTNNTCPTTCSGACATGFTCIANSCGLKPLGSACVAGSECQSNFCVGNFCCSSSQCGNCGTCSTGNCAPVNSGSAGSPTSCSPYVCSGQSQSCPTNCTSDANCISADYCNLTTSQCQPKLGPGQSCTTGNQCQQGFCAGGFCCSSACGYCGSCSSGSCVNVDAGSPGVPPCGQYVCSGSGPACPNSCTADVACIASDYCDTTMNQCVSKLNNGTVCSANNQCTSGMCLAGHCCGTACGSCGSCTTGTCTPDPNGSPGSPTSCAPYVCNGGTTCPNVCNGDPDCAPGFYCTGANGNCAMKKPDGQPCVLAHECNSSACNPFYRDADGDGYGDRLAAKMTLCGLVTTPPSGYSTNNLDFCDSDARTNPAQTGFFPNPDNCNQWDYNCDGTLEPQYTAGFAGCTFPNVCAGATNASTGAGLGFDCMGITAFSPGWGMLSPAANSNQAAYVAAPAPPGCGQVALYVSSCSGLSGGQATACGTATYCLFGANTTQQGCH